jgi:hypothetical protein
MRSPRRRFAWVNIPRVRSSLPRPAVPRTLQAADVFVRFLCLYVLTASRTVPFGDAAPMWEAARNFVQHGSFAISHPWPVNAPAGRGGLYYPVAALLACLVHVPGALLQSLLERLTAAGAAAPLTAQLAPLLLGALVPTLSFGMFQRLGYDRRQVAVTTLLLGTGTSVMVYAHRPYSEIVQAACFVFFFDALMRAERHPQRRALLRLGVAAGLLINSKNVYFACFPGACLLLAFRWRAPRGLLLRRLGWAGAGLLPGLLAFLAYNQVRWGSPFASGYGGAVTAGFWRENVLVGLWGQFLSPGKSVFLYSPPLLLALFGVRRFVTRRPAVAAAVALTAGPIVLIYARYIFWSGDWAWGPRYLLFALPVFVLPIAELLRPMESTESAPMRQRRAGRIAFGAVAAAALFVQLLGTAFDWSDFIKISMDVQHAWLGQPDVSGTPIAPAPCFSCFEHLYPLQWLPPMQPIRGHWWLLVHKLAGDDWRSAQADAPWKIYTSLTPDIQAAYDTAALDWWLAMPTLHGRWPLLLVVLLLVLAMPIRPWLTALRSTDSAPPR